MKSSTFLRSLLLLTSSLVWLAPPAMAQATGADPATPSLQILWPTEGSTIQLGTDSDRAIGMVVGSNFRLKPAGQCGDDKQCGHVHLKIDPNGDSCNQPGKPYNSMNSDFGGPLIAARFGFCTQATGEHVIGILLADDHHRPVLVNGQPVTALVKVKTQ